mmetsp:Transcript_41165/g.162505  ORF Transcript_41165/g.162505 Transcript_41165/m.162505 type:complete len:155 (-) Transcript_41165:119-583(-)
MLSVISSPKNRGMFPQERIKQQVRENRVDIPVVGPGAPVRRSAPLEMERQRSANRFPARGSPPTDNSIQGKSKSFALGRSPTDENFRRHHMRRSSTEESLPRLQSGGGSPDNALRSITSARSPPMKINKQDSIPAADSLKRAQSSRLPRRGLVI